MKSATYRNHTRIVIGYFSLLFRLYLSISISLYLYISISIYLSIHLILSYPILSYPILSIYIYNINIYIYIIHTPYSVDLHPPPWGLAGSGRCLVGRERCAEGVAAAPRRRGGEAAPWIPGGTTAAGLPGTEEGGAWDGYPLVMSK